MPRSLERRGERVAARVAHHEEVVDGAGVGLLRGQADAAAVELAR